VVVYLCASWAAYAMILAANQSLVGLVVVYLCASWAARDNFCSQTATGGSGMDLFVWHAVVI